MEVLLLKGHQENIVHLFEKMKKAIVTFSFQNWQ
jgi:hypothetical protein